MVFLLVAPQAWVVLKEVSGMSSPLAALWPWPCLLLVLASCPPTVSTCTVITGRLSARSRPVAPTGTGAGALSPPCQHHSAAQR